jgi:hypothetical protein
MKLLVIIANHILKPEWCTNIRSINNNIKTDDIEIDYCGISNQDDFHVFEHIITFKYKIINTKHQFSKICDFITLFKSQLNYDWFMKIRPEVLLLDKLSFDGLSLLAINARAREYNGPLEIKYGMSVNGKGIWENIGDCYYDTYEHDIILDDMIYLFHKTVVDLNGFDTLIHDLPLFEHESFHTMTFNKRNIRLNVIGINLCFTKYDTYSGHINMPPVIKKGSEKVISTHYDSMNSSISINTTPHYDVLLSPKSVTKKSRPMFRRFFKK